MSASTNNTNHRPTPGGQKRRRALAYIRSATIEPHYGLNGKFGSNAERQEHKIRDWAAANDVVIDDIYRDEGVSGLRRDRPGLDRLFRRLDQQHTANSGDELLVVMNDRARLARNRHLDMELLDAIAARGATVVFTDIEVDDHVAVLEVQREMLR
jgi:DNA invertase Pin-like site-specific DNA recombinase